MKTGKNIYLGKYILELVPRFYMETALLKCHKFSCEPEGFSSLVERLSLMVRGIANPIVAAYARMYLIHTVQQGNTNSNSARLNKHIIN